MSETTFQTFTLQDLERVTREVFSNPIEPERYPLKKRAIRTCKGVRDTQRALHSAFLHCQTRLQSFLYINRQILVMEKA